MTEIWFFHMILIVLRRWVFFSSLSILSMFKSQPLEFEKYLYVTNSLLAIELLEQSYGRQNVQKLFVSYFIQ